MLDADRVLLHHPREDREFGSASPLGAERNEERGGFDVGSRPCISAVIAVSASSDVKSCPATNRSSNSRHSMNEECTRSGPLSPVS